MQTHTQIQNQEVFFSKNLEDSQEHSNVDDAPKPAYQVRDPWEIEPHLKTCWYSTSLHSLKDAQKINYGKKYKYILYILFEG